MPYAVPVHSPTSPSTSFATSPTSTSPIITTRANLRRSRSSFSDEQGPGAFVPMGALPKRRPTSRKAVFHINADDDSPQERDDDGSAPVDGVGLPPSLSSSAHFSGRDYSPFRGSGSSPPSSVSPSFIELPSTQDPVPFPTSSPLPSPSHTIPTRSPSHSSPSRPYSLPRVPSTPVILSNGKPLKSSLKSSSSSPNIAGDMQRTKHLRAQSAPSTPNLAHKNVHFAEKDSGLETVKLFKRSGKPASLSKASGDETETETEAENNPTSKDGFPFPSLTSGLFASSASSVASTSQTASKPIIHEIDPSPNLTSAIPQPSPSPNANVHLETVTLPRTRPPTLRGTVLVRNVAYEKSVAVRFTLDDWQTTSEVTCRHVVSLPGLPPPFPRISKPSAVEGDVATRVVVGEEEELMQPSWDRFSFTIRLEDYESKLSERTLYLVTRFSSPPGEWWDNNEGKNYRVGFRRAVASPLTSPLNTPTATSPFMPVTSLPNVAAVPLVPSGVTGIPAQFLASVNNSLATAAASGLSQQRTFSAPSALRYTPMTGALAGVPVVGGRPETPPLSRSMSSPYPSNSPSRQATQLPQTSGSSPVRSHSSPSPLSNHVALPGGKDPQGRSATLPRVHPSASQSAAHAGSFIKRRLSLSNYVAPGTPVVKPTIAITAVSTPSGSEGLVTPPTTPPNMGRSRSSSLPTDFEYKPVEETSVSHERPHEFEDIASAPRITLIGGMPATTVEPVVPESEVPFSPTSPSRKPIHFMSFEGLGLSGISGTVGDVRGLVSPPRSRDASEDGGSGEGGRSSPTLPILDLKIPGALGPVKLRSTSPTSSPPNERSKDQAGSPAASTPSSASSSSSSVSSMFRSLESPLSPVGVNAGRVDTTDSSYAAFVRQWCFAQSTPPTPGVHHSPDSNEGSAQKASPSGGYSASGASASAGKKWPGAGYGFPGFNFGVGVTPDAGMVGALMR